MNAAGAPVNRYLTARMQKRRRRPPAGERRILAELDDLLEENAEKARRAAVARARATQEAARPPFGEADDGRRGD